MFAFASWVTFLLSINYSSELPYEEACLSLLGPSMSKMRPTEDPLGPRSIALCRHISLLASDWENGACSVVMVEVIAHSQGEIKTLFVPHATGTLSWRLLSEECLWTRDTKHAVRQRLSGGSSRCGMTCQVILASWLKTETSFKSFNCSQFKVIAKIICT